MADDEEECRVCGETHKSQFTCDYCGAALCEACSSNDGFCGATCRESAEKD